MDITWNAVSGSSTTFHARNDAWRLSLSGTALSLEYLGDKNAFFRVLIVVDSVPFSFHRHFPDDAGILIADSFSATHTVSVKALFHIPVFRNQVCAEKPGTPLCELFVELETEQPPVTPPPSLIPPPQQTQRDVQLFFLRVLGEADSDLFSGIFSVVSQAACGCETRATEPFHDIAVDVRKTLEDALRAFLSAKVPEQHACKEHGMCETTIHRAVSEWPDVLAIHLKRPETQDGGVLEYCKYPFFISLDMLPSYKLYAVIVRESEAEGTHYFSHVLMNGRWTKLNDSSVTHLNDFEALVFGGHHPVTGEAMKCAAHTLFYVKESEWDRVFHSEEGILTRIATSHNPRLRLDASPVRFLTQSTNNYQETVAESYSPSSSVPGYISRLADMGAPDEAADPGLSFYFSISDVPRYTALTLFSSEYPSVRLRPIKNDFLSKIQVKLWLPRKPDFFALFRVTEDKTERVDGSARARGDTFFCIGADYEPHGAVDDKKRLYFVKRYTPTQMCRHLFPRSLVLTGYVFAGDSDFDAIDHFRVEGDEVRKVERKDTRGEGTLNFLRENGQQEIVLDGIYVVSTSDHEEYFRFRKWVRERKCLGGVFVERSTSVGRLEGVIREAFMSRGVSVDWKRSVLREPGSTLESESAMETARSQSSVTVASKEMNADCVESLSVLVHDTHRTVFVGQGDDNYNEIDHIHSVVLRKDASAESLRRKLRHCECLCLDEEFSLIRTRKNSFELAVMSRNERLFSDECLIVVQNLKRGRFNKVVFTAGGDPCGYPFFLCTESLQRFGSICARYGAVSLVVKRGPLLVVVDDDDEIGDEMLLVEVGE
ncbi:UNVERIFIED_CONTAM: hypothetical protein PYX00_011702 [Menopon gallinae]|uniref:ubiquitinyl hydrolase 1 n=1 Tax=Menopon gallinae TaxID=328185 RepID=A0AAW2H884_9NEOP